MKELTYGLETVEAFVEPNLVIFREDGYTEQWRRVFFFELALAELLYDPVGLHDVPTEAEIFEKTGREPLLYVG